MGYMMTTCFRCSTPFDAYSSKNRFCSVKCRNAHKNSLKIKMLDGTRKKPSTVQTFTCQVCEIKFSRSVGDSTVTTKVITCSQKCSKILHNRMAYEPLRKSGTIQLYECRYCGDTIVYTVKGRGGPWSCDSCKLKNKKARDRRHIALGGRAKRRAGYYDTPYENIDKFEIFKRDNWICQLCKEPVDPDCEFPSLRYATVDHIIPLSVEGTPGHVWGNVQLAHFSCNSRKGNRQ